MSDASVGIKILLDDGASAGLGHLKGSLGGLVTQADMLKQGFQHMGTAAQAAGIIAAGSGLVFSGFAGALHDVIGKAMDLELSLSHVKASVQGATNVMPALKSDIIGIANQSKFTSKDVADAFVELGKKGFTAGQILSNKGELGLAVVNFAEATNLKAVPAAQLLGSTLRAFGADAADSAQFADVLTAAFNNGLGTSGDLQGAFSQVSGRAHEVGWSVTDTAVALDLLAQKMGSGSQAGTSLQYMIASLTNPTAAVSKELASLGVITLNQNVPAFKALEDAYSKTGSASGKNNITFDGTITSLKGQYDAAQKMGLLHTDQTFYQWAVKNGMLNDKLYDSTGKFKNLAGVVDTLGGAMKGKPQEMDALIGALGGARSGKAFSALLDNVGNTDQKMADLYKRFADTSASKKAADQMDNLSSTIQKLGTTFSDAEALIGLPMLIPLEQWGNKLNDLVSSMETTNPAIFGLIGNFLLIGAAVSGAIFFVSSFIFIASAILSSPIILGVAAVALATTGLAVAATAVQQNWGTLHAMFQPIIDIFKGVWQILVTLGGVVKDIALNAFGHLRDAAGSVKGHFSELNPIFSSVQGWLHAVNNAIKLLEPSLLEGMDKAARGLGIAAKFVHDHWYLLTPVFHAIGAVLGFVFDTAGKLLGLAWEGIVIIVHKLGDAGEWVFVHWGKISTIFHHAADALGKVKDVIASLALGALGGIAAAAHKVGDAAQWVITHWSQVRGILGMVFSLIASSIPSLLTLGGAIVLIANWSSVMAGVKGVIGVFTFLDKAILKVATNLAVFAIDAAEEVMTSSAGVIPALWAMVAPLLAEAGAALLAIAPWVIAGVIFAAALVGLVMLIQHFNLWPKILGTFNVAWSMIVKEFQSLVKVIQGEVMSALKQMHPAWLQLVDAFNLAKPVLVVLGGVLLGVLGLAFTVVLGLIIGFIRALGGIIHMVVSVVLGIVQVFSGLITFFDGLFKLIHDIFTGNTKALGADLQQMGRGILMIFTGIWTAISGIIGGFFQAIGGLLSGFISAFIGMFNHLKDMLVGHSIVPEMLTAIFGWFNRLPAEVGGAVNRMVQGVLGFFGHLKDQAWQSILALGVLVYRGFDLIVTTVPPKIGGMIQGVLSFFTSLPGKILTALGNLGSLLLQAGQAMIQGLIQGILSQIGNLTGAAGKIAQGIANIFQHHSPPKEGPLATDDQWMKTMMVMHATQITAATPMLTKAAHLAALGIQSAFNSPSQLSLSTSAARGAVGGGQAGGGHAGDHNITINTYMDSKQVGQIFINTLTGQLKSNGIQRLNR